MENPKEEDKQKQGLSNFAVYTGLGFQMLATIAVFAFIGYKIDQYRNGTKQIFTAVFGLLGVVLSLFQVVRSVNKRN